VETIGGLQALEVLKMITEICNPLKNRLLVFGGINAWFDEIQTIRNANYPMCDE